MLSLAIPVFTILWGPRCNKGITVSLRLISKQCFGSGSKLDPYSGTLWSVFRMGIRIHTTQVKGVRLTTKNSLFRYSTDYGTSPVPVINSFGAINLLLFLKKDLVSNKKNFF